MEKKELKVVSYTWHSYFDEALEKSFSNWDEAEHCDLCDTKIVHVYEMSNGQRVGKCCALKKLGYTKKKFEKEVWDAQAEERELERLHGNCLNFFGKKTKAEALVQCYRRNTPTHQIDPTTLKNLSLGANIFNYSMLELDGKFVAYPKAATRYEKLLEKGWKKIDNF